MHDDVTDDSDATLDRRSLIKKIGVAGAVAWTAPVVMDSVLSPAAAQSSPGGGGGPGCAVSYSEGFELVNSTANGNYSTYPVGSLTGATGWSVSAGSVDAITTPSPFNTGGFPNGTTVIELGGSVGPAAGAGTLTRTFTIPCTGTLSFSFDWSNPSTHNTTVTVTQGAANLIPPVTLTAQGLGVQTLFSELFTGVAVTAGSVVVTFTATGNDNTGAIIDNVVLAAS